MTRCSTCREEQQPEKIGGKIHRQYRRESIKFPVAEPDQMKDAVQHPDHGGEPSRRLSDISVLSLCVSSAGRDQSLRTIWAIWAQSGHIPRQSEIILVYV